MSSNINKNTAKLIIGAIRRRRFKAVLFRTNTGFRLRPLHQVSDVRLGADDVVGVYNYRVSSDRIVEDWNDTL